ncbi:helix-turn-helix transcriptional regulator (plasmid) [Deinococcus radiomollis]|uniref:helix-turn-helix domain-containing protein n=1 Tax=Deinococcus radiomollis TaxID=468916 RepID=UPI0038917631
MADDLQSIRQRLADNLRRLRTEQGWSQEQLAALAGLHHNHISAIERCKLSVGIDVLEKLALTFGVTAGELLD